ncbi:hypothetical protein ACFPT7_24385 [Acidicapsa dinghuensis]|uniref:Adenylate cyclase n=1 Tax=Acidicapsa dinghuensis TaxID=2218256 RepID=A0ABW1EMH2_9BACT|nr:hypothetical protein [Acidicapsa dinghuensis]
MKRLVQFLLLALVTLVLARPVFAQVAVSVSFGPPAIPVYDQPLCPGDGYLWVPGYWAYDDDDGYYWVPGTWVLAPEPGYLWTPGWWGWEGTGFFFHEGYWATEIGFYGGINYGFGYYGTGFVGGRWEGREFRYNTAVFNVNTTVIRNTYVDRTVIVNNTTVNRVSYNGGQGGIIARATPQEERVAQMQHVPPPQAQTQHVQAARANPQLRATSNQGKPPIAATERPGSFSGSGTVEAKEAGAPYHAPERGGTQPNNGRPAENPGTAEHPANPTHAADLPQHQVTTPNTGDPKLDEKYQKQQQKLVDQQNKEHQKLEQQQQKEDQKLTQQQANEAKKQQTEQKHQQQTQQLEQRHQQQTQQLQTRQAPRSAAPRPAPRPR